MITTIVAISLSPGNTRSEVTNWKQGSPAICCWLPPSPLLSVLHSPLQWLPVLLRCASRLPCRSTWAASRSDHDHLSLLFFLLIIIHALGIPPQVAIDSRFHGTSATLYHSSFSDNHHAACLPALSYDDRFRKDELHCFYSLFSVPLVCCLLSAWKKRYTREDNNSRMRRSPDGSCPTLIPLGEANFERGETGDHLLCMHFTADDDGLILGEAGWQAGASLLPRKRVSLHKSLSSEKHTHIPRLLPHSLLHTEHHSSPCFSSSFVFIPLPASLSWSHEVIAVSFCSCLFGGSSLSWFSFVISPSPHQHSSFPFPNLLWWRSALHPEFYLSSTDDHRPKRATRATISKGAASTSLSIISIHAMSNSTSPELLTDSSLPFSSHLRIWNASKSLKLMNGRKSHSLLLFIREGNLKLFSPTSWFQRLERDLHLLSCLFCLSSSFGYPGFWICLLVFFWT